MTQAASLPVVILCGGLGTRLREETEFRPKPLVPVGERPILWHIMKIYSAFGCRDYVLALGYKGEMVKDYFVNYRLRNTDLRIDLQSHEIELLGDVEEVDWRVTLVDTGRDSMTGGRLKRLEPMLRHEPAFLMTYGDGVCDIDIGALVDFHRRSGCVVTVTGVRPLARFGELELDGNRVVRFAEKPQTEGEWINGGFFVMSPRIFDYIDGDSSILEREPLERIATDGLMSVFRHDGFWRCMDTVRDMEALNEAWASGHAPWKRW